MPSLLSPAGNMEKLRSAINFGADAVYLSGKQFGMRASADNFTKDELEEAIVFAHSNGVMVNITVNTMPRYYEYSALEDYLSFLASIKPDALIAADMGVVSLARQKAPDIPLHLSTQASVVSPESANFYHSAGIKRIVLARELTLDEIKQIRIKTPPSLELETFIHGSMCVSYSGRCLLSNSLASRDGNRGMCAQTCRWKYRIAYIEEEMRPGELIPVQEDDFGTYIMSSKDLCMIDHVPELIESGIDCFKIEGRMKSSYYTAAVTNAYRIAIDSYMKDKSFKSDPLLLRELEGVSHREYSTGYYFDNVNEHANTCSSLPVIGEGSYIAIALSDADENGFALFEQKNKCKIGESAELLTPGSVGKSFLISELQNQSGESIGSTPHAKMRYYMKTPFPVKKGDIIRKAID